MTASDTKIVIAAHYTIHPRIWGGMDEFFAQICSRLTDRGIKPIVVLPHLKGVDSSHYQSRGIPHVMIDSPLFFSGLVEFCNQNPSNIIHAHFLSVLTRHFSKLSSSTGTIITTEHMSRPCLGWSLIKKLKSRVSAIEGSRAVSTMVHVSKYIENENRLSFGRCITEKSKVIYNGVKIDDLSRIYPSAIDPSRKLKLISAGRLVFEKGFSDLIAITKRLLAYYGDVVELDILGDGQLRSQLEAESGEYLDRNIFFRGYVNDVRQRLRQADLYVHCASQEAFAFVLLEAGEAGLPIVTYDIGGNREAVIDGFNGFLVHANDIDGFVSNVGYFFENVAQIQRFGNNSRNLVQASFSMEKMVNHYLDLYNQYLF